MKKHLLSLTLLGLLSAIPAKAAQIWYDVITNYPLGCITTNTAAWFSHPPGSGFDSLIVSNNYTSGAAVSGRRLRVDGTKTEYVMRLFDPVNTNSITSGSIYVSFVANANFVPTAGAGTYFAALNNVDPDLNVTNGFNFLGRIFQIGNTNAYPFTNTVPLTYRFGVLNQGGDPASNPNFASTIKFAPIDLIRNVDYHVVMKYI